MIGILSVTYKESFESSPLFKSLKSISVKDKLDYKVFNFYNASEVNRTKEHNHYAECETTENGGLALGYNAGIEYFKSFENVDHLLFLNSDCQLNGEILHQYNRLAVKGNSDFYFPKLICQDIVISPFRKPGFAFDFYIIAWTLVKKSKLVDFTFDMRYWLDGIDYEFSVWFKEHELIGEAVDATVTHDLSVITSYSKIPDWRILNIYNSEKLFLKRGFRFILFKGIVRSLIKRRFQLAIKLLKLY